MGVKYTPTRQRAKSIAKSLWRIWQKIQDKSQAEYFFGLAIRDQILAQSEPWDLLPEELLEIPADHWTTFISRCQTARNPTDPS